MPILCLVVDHRYRATGYGILNFLSTCIGGIGLYAGGVLRDSKFNLGIMFQFASVIMIIGAFVLYLLKPQQPEKDTK